ncbi:MAG: Stp1/IreP family PP2C-type Ser/Thr phosphatase [Bacilli bacterium]
MVTFETVFQTDRGQVRSYNEDCGIILPHNTAPLLLAVIADGMGGHQAGDVASQMAVAHLKEAWQKESGIITRPIDAEAWLKSEIEHVNGVMYAHSVATEGCEGMGTTLVVAICANAWVSVAHIGDSRCYLYQQGALKRVTEDHSLVNELLKTGALTEEDAANYPRKNVLLRALGTEEQVNMDQVTLPVEDEVVLLLCSDGLSNKLTDVELEAMLIGEAALQALAEQLTAVANARGGEDNISIALVRFKAGDDE